MTQSNHLTNAALALSVLLSELDAARDELPDKILFYVDGLEDMANKLENHLARLCAKSVKGISMKDKFPPCPACGRKGRTTHYYFNKKSGTFTDSSRPINDDDCVRLTNVEYAVSRLFMSGYDQVSIHSAVYYVAKLLKDKERE